MKPRSPSSIGSSHMMQELPTGVGTCSASSVIGASHGLPKNGFGSRSSIVICSVPMHNLHHSQPESPLLSVERLRGQRLLDHADQFVPAPRRLDLVALGR